MLKMRPLLEKNQMAGIYFFHGQMPEMRFPMVVAILNSASFALAV